MLSSIDHHHAETRYCNAAEYLLGNQASGSAEALIDGDRRYSYDEIHRGVATIALLLKDSGLRQGDTAVILDQNSYFWACAYLGTMSQGCVSVPLPVNIHPEQFRRIVKNTNAKAILTGSTALKRPGLVLPSDIAIISDLPAEDELKALSLFQKMDSGGSNHPIDYVEVDVANQIAALMFTSGSTGNPSGVMVTHQNIMANTASIIEYLELTASDRVMAFLPFYYCFGTSLLHTHLRVGGSLVLENSFLFPDNILKRMVETGCTEVAGVPSNYQILLRRSSLKKATLPKLRIVQQAGGKLHDMFLDELRESIPHARIFVMYGQTEATARLSYLPPDLLDRKRGSIGKGIPGVELQVLDEEGRRVSPGEVGEIVAKGDNISLGYWQDPVATSHAFRGRRLHTGDLATVDDEGYIFVVDRVKDFIKCGGNRVGCSAIEDVLLRYPGMIELAAIPQFDQTLGEAVCLCAVHREGASVREDFVRYCGQNLPWEQVPRSIHFLKELPRNFSGKTDKLALRRTYGMGAASAVSPFKTAQEEKTK